jgi:hypothetical protein
VCVAASQSECRMHTSDSGAQTLRSPLPSAPPSLLLAHTRLCLLCRLWTARGGDVPGSRESRPWPLASLHPRARAQSAPPPTSVHPPSTRASPMTLGSDLRLRSSTRPMRAITTATEDGT